MDDHRLQVHHGRLKCISQLFALKHIVNEWTTIGKKKLCLPILATRYLIPVVSYRVQILLIRFEILGIH